MANQFKLVKIKKHEINWWIKEIRWIYWFSPVRIMNDVCLFSGTKNWKYECTCTNVFHHFDVIFLPFFRWHISITNFEQFIFHKGKLPFKSIRSKSFITIIITRWSENMYVLHLIHLVKVTKPQNVFSNSSHFQTIDQK